MKLRLSAFTNNRKRHPAAAPGLGIASLLFLCVALGGCQRQENVTAGTNETPVLSFDGTFEVPPSALDPVPPADLPDGNAHLNPAFLYWLAAGNQVLAAWSDFTLNFPCSNYQTQMCGNPLSNFPPSCQGSVPSRRPRMAAVRLLRW
jgi:hypothetical protein